jgi:alcohol dehydrogenase (cytochrome c)
MRKIFFAYFVGCLVWCRCLHAGPTAIPQQIDDGKAAYIVECAHCHGANLNDGSAPPLKDQGFQTSWLGKSSKALAAFIRSSMPPNNAGGLSAETYNDIAAYIFSANIVALTQSAPQAVEGGSPGRNRTAGSKNGGGTSERGQLSFATRPSRLLSELTPVTDTTLSHPRDSDWLMWRRTYNGWGYSPLKQISKKNVRHLELAWTWSLNPGVSETTPLVHDGVLFVHNSGDRIQALNAATGDLLWEYVRNLTPRQIAGSGNQLTKRNIAIFGDNIISATADVHLIALNQKTGALVWDVKVADWDQGYRFSGGPMVADGKIIQGMAGCRSFEPGGCFITAHDPATGKELWRVHTVAQDGKEGDSWNGVPVEERFGASAWMSGSYDPDLKTIYYGTGNSYGLIPNVYPGSNKPDTSNDALYTNSTLAIDPERGVLKWYFQHLPTDIWDLDYGFERILVDLPVGRVVTKQVITSGKPAILESLDRVNGSWLWSKDTVSQNIVLAIDPKTGKKTINPTMFPRPDGRATTHCPSDPGGRAWPASAYDPRTLTLYLPLNEFCSSESGGLMMRPQSNGKIGRIDAINLETRATAWSFHQRASMTSALLPTGGGVLFGGDSDRYFRAYDSRTGEILWQMRTNSIVNSFPITYSVKGKQYVAVVVGAGSTFPHQMSALTPEIPNPPLGTVLWVFTLSGGVPQQ